MSQSFAQGKLELTSMYFLALCNRAKVVNLSGNGTCCRSTSKQSRSWARLQQNKRITTHAHMHTHMQHAHMHTLTHAHAHTCTPTLTHAHPTLTHAHPRSYMHTHTRSHMHTHTCSLMNTHTLPHSSIFLFLPNHHSSLPSELSTNLCN